MLRFIGLCILFIYSTLILKFDEVEKSSHANYRCLAKNVAGNTSAIVSLFKFCLDFLRPTNYIFYALKAEPPLEICE